MTLEFLDGEILFLRDGSYRWLRLHRFRCDLNASDPTLLSALLSHSRYQDCYLQPDTDWSPSGDQHGPYRLDRLSVDSFESIDAALAEAFVLGWAEEYDGREGRGFELILKAANAVINRASSLWRLQDLHDSAQHETGWMLDDFCEIVAIDRVRRTLTLLIASGD